MPQKNTYRWNITDALLSIFAGACLCMITFAIFMITLFEFRYTNTFAKETLEQKNFKEVSILKKYTIAKRYGGPPTIPTENWFDFTAYKNNTLLNGRLVCHRQFWDISESRCTVEVHSL